MAYKIQKDNQLGKTIIVLTNPVSGRKQGEKTLKKYVEPFLNKYNLHYQNYTTQKRGQAEEICSNQVKINENTQAIIIISGDGTIHECVNRLLRNPVFCTNDNNNLKKNLNYSTDITTLSREEN